MLSATVILLLSVFSLSVWGVIVQRWGQGRPALDRLPRNPSPWLPIACGAAAIFVALMLLVSLGTLLISPDATPTVDLSRVQWSVVYGVGEIAIVLVLLTAFGRVPFREVGIHAQHLGRQLSDGLGGFFASLAPIYLVLYATSSLRTPDNQHPFLKLLEGHRTGETIAWLMLSAVIVAPIKEELLFRVILQDGLARRIGSTAAIGSVSLLFCVVHGFPDSLALLPLALILGYIYDRRQSVLSVVLIHALFNLTNIGIMLLEP